MNAYLTPQDFLTFADLVDRRVYTLNSRNLAVGVWNAETNGFIGVREKFGDKYLFTEYLWTETSGTARAIGDLEVDVPSEIPLRERTPSIDSVTGREVFFDKPVYSGGRGWIYRDTELPIDGEPYARTNQELFDLLSPYDEAECAARAKRYEATKE